VCTPRCVFVRVGRELNMASGLASDLQQLNAIPDVSGPAADRRRRVALGSKTQQPVKTRPAVTYPVSPRSSIPPPAPNVETVRALEHYLGETVAGVPRGAPERLQAYRYVFTALIGQLPGHGPLLAEVKAEYDATIEAIRTLQAPQSGQGALHPLQLPTAYYEREMQRAKKELARTRDRVKVLKEERSGEVHVWHTSLGVQVSWLMSWRLSASWEACLG